jgi:hypothetical protein
MVDAPGKIENKIVDISVILRNEGNVITAFYRFFHKEINAENRNKKNILKGKNGGCAGDDVKQNC